MDYMCSTGETAGRIYGALEGAQGRELVLSDLKKRVGGKCFDYAVGWLLRENRISLEARGKSVTVRLN
jgi:hypothetical protein